MGACSDSEKLASAQSPNRGGGRGLTSVECKKRVRCLEPFGEGGGWSTPLNQTRSQGLSSPWERGSERKNVLRNFYAHIRSRAQVIRK